MDSDRTNVVVASAWMVGISLLLFFLPLVNGLIGGAVGGYKAGTPKRGLLAALIPSLLVAAGLWAIFAVFGGPVMGFFAGAAAFFAGAAAFFAGAACFAGAFFAVALIELSVWSE